jgi:hypothetical protein
MAEAYDDEAEATGWCGPEVALGLMYRYIQQDQTILDIGIGTGQIEGWVRRFAFSVLKSLPFTVFMNREKTQCFQAMAYLVIKTTGNE